MRGSIPLILRTNRLSGRSAETGKPRDLGGSLGPRVKKMFRTFFGIAGASAAREGRDKVRRERGDQGEDRRSKVLSARVFSRSGVENEWVLSTSNLHTRNIVRSRVLLILQRMGFTQSTGRFDFRKCSRRGLYLYPLDIRALEAQP